MNKNLLLIFVKNPELGKCKTRLAATIGDEKALTFYKNMLRHTKEIVSNINADIQVYYSSFIDEGDLWPNEGKFSKALQTDGDLGDKMKNAFENGFEQGYDNICIIGSDCYSLSDHIINGAFTALNNKEAVIGPSTDGGYYLLGMSKMMASLFENKNWSTESVTPDTIKDLEEKEVAYELLTALTDIDNEEDLNTIPIDIKEKLLSNF